MRLRFATWFFSRISSTANRKNGRRRRRETSAGEHLGAEIQLLDERCLLSGSPATPFAVTDLVRYSSGTVGPDALGGSVPTGYTPAQIRQAYGFNQISFNGTAGDGTGTTIAIVDSYDDPNIANDLHQFDLAFGLKDPPNFTKVNQLGSTSNLPAADAGWISEIALDVEWAHAVAQGANIVLVEANSSSDSDLNTAVNTARNYAGVDVVSMSWGGSEYSTETKDDSFYTTPAGHQGVTFVTSSGDTGAPTSYPSASPNVVSVGGTTLNLTSNGSWSSETGWSGSGGGISAVEAQPAYQKGVVTQTTTFRANPDVSYDADPNTGFPVYDSYNNGTTSPWGQWGGTSDAAPQWAALIAIADQGRAIAGQGSLDGATQTLPLLYSMSANDFHDITSGTSTGTTQYSAGPGYDLVTGRGTPFANLVVNDLIGSPVNVTPPPTLTAVSTLGAAYEQLPFGISYATLLGASNAQDFNGAAIQFRINTVQNGTLTITHNGVTTAVVAGTTLLGSGDTLTWTGATGVSGSAVNAFTITAFDGSLSSSPPAQVTINVQALGNAFNLSGAWIVNNSSGTTIGLGRITQNGASLSFVNTNNVSSSGQYISPNQVVAANFDNQSSVTGAIDTSAADQGRIIWSDGTVWLRVSLAGQYAVLTPGSNVSTLASISQTGSSLSLVNGLVSTTASITSATQLQVVASGKKSTATYADGKITFSSTGQVWTKLDLPSNYTNQSGAATHVIQNGATLTFVDKLGNTSPGYWISPTQVFATAWNESATTAPGKLLWQDGSFWSENLVFNGSNNGAGTTTISAAPSQVSDFNYVNSNGLPVHLVQTGTTNIIIIDATGHMSIGTFIGPSQFTTPYFPGDVATISPDMSTVTWTDGSHWTQAASNAITLTNFTNQNGVPVHLIQNGTNQIGFVDGLGRTSLGTMLSATTALADLYPGDLATISGNTVTWQDGFVWTLTNVSSLTTTFTDSNGAVSHVQLTSLTTLTGLDGPLQSLTATRHNGQIIWSNGAVWDDFDFNALNALFEMAMGYP